MADNFTTRTIVNGPIEEVFDLSLSVDLHQASFAHTNEEIVDGVTSGGMILGDTVTWRARHFGVWWTMTSMISGYDRPHFFVDEQVRGPFKAFRHRHEFRSVEAGTEMVDIVDYQAPLGPVGMLAERLLLGRHLRALIALRNHQLVTMFEVSEVE